MAFLANPFKLTKQLLGQKRTGRLTCTRDAINDHLKHTYSDCRMEQPLGSCKVPSGVPYKVHTAQSYSIGFGGP